MVLKEDMQEAKDRLACWWDKEQTDRPIIAYSYVRQDVLKMINQDNWYIAKYWDDIENYVKNFEDHAKCMFYGGESIPNLWINYGPGIMAALLGVEPKYMNETMWFDRPTPLYEIVDLLESAQINDNNEWYARIIRNTEYAADHSQGNYSVGFTDIGGILDILSSFMGPTQLIIAMRRAPEIIDTCRSIILEKTLKFYDDLAAIQERYSLGYDAWMGIWCPKRWYPMQCDFSACLSPKLFQRFVLPDLIAQAEHMDYAIYHLDGPNELPYLDDLLACDSITGIQWVPGVQGPVNTDPKWLPVYKKIQAAGKNIVIDPPSQNVAKIYQNLDPKGIYASTGFISQILAEFYLPKWMGGFEGIEPDE